MPYEPVIGLEIHAELKTRTKMFCASLNDPLEKHPNINACPVCLGHPGTLPVPNKEAIRMVQLVGAALHGALAEFSKFDRKNYFYPDLPKGYQISQYDQPFCVGGYLEIPVSDQAQNPESAKQILNSKFKKINITRVHLEEDTGKLLHPEGGKETLVDFNRAGIPLMELVTEPDLRSGEEAALFAQELQLILRYLGVSDANMEQGQMRVEVNISLREISRNAAKDNAKLREKNLGIKVEIKNLNSFRSVRAAADYEVARQTGLLERGEKIAQETRGWHDTKQKTFSQRSKEEAHDYRYFPEPDIPPLRFSKETLDEIHASIPELPAQKRERFQRQLGVSLKEAALLVSEKTLADYFEAVLSELDAWQEADPSGKPRDTLRKLAINYLLSDMLGLLRERQASFSDLRITPENFAELIKLLAQGRITSRVAKDVLVRMFETGGDPLDIVAAENLAHIDDENALREIARNVIAANPKAAEDFRGGKEAALQFLVGQVARETRGTMSPQSAAVLLREQLGA